VKTPKLLALNDMVDFIAGQSKGGRFFMASGPVEPLALTSAFAQGPGTSEGLTCCSVSLPGLNTFDFAALHRGAQAEIFLPSPDRAATIATGQTRVLPLHYSGVYRYLRQAPFKLAVFHVAPPNSDGMCSLSLSADASPAFFDRDVVKVAIVNKSLPDIIGAPSVPLSLFDAVCEVDQAPTTLEATSGQAEASQIARHICNLVPDGATIQAGIGRLPGSVMAALKGHKRLRLHSGLIGDWALDLINAGVFIDEPDALVAGIILGGYELHAAMANEPRLSLRPINQTHSHSILSAIPKFTSINAALEIDLYGQINCEFAGKRTLAGVGGAVDFLRGARASKGGKPIVMIQSEGKGGISRFVPRLSTPCVSIARSDAPILVSEFGAIDLEPLDTQARAKAIISLAHPNHRQALSDAWKHMSL
jgi:acyl-CoA hydrolase